MSESRYWFARRWPLGNPRNTMSPISREGWVVAWGFVIAMAIGGLALLFLGMNGQLVSGAAIFALLALVGGGMFIGMSWGPRGDRKHTVDDYKSGRVSNV